jgi:hypothetical protein
LSNTEEQKLIEDIARDEALRLFKERPDEVIFDELKRSYDKQWNLKDSHERKATSFITISGIITTLLFGFSGFLQNPSILITNFGTVLFFITLSIIANVLAVLFSIISLKMKDYSFILTDIDDTILTEQRAKNKVQVIDNLINEYHKSVSHNSRQNDSKLTWLKVAYWLLFSGIAIIPIPFLLSFYR